MRQLHVFWILFHITKALQTGQLKDLERSISLPTTDYMCKVSIRAAQFKIPHTSSFLKIAKFCGVMQSQ